MKQQGLAVAALFALVGACSFYGGYATEPTITIGRGKEPALRAIRMWSVIPSELATKSLGLRASTFVGAIGDRFAVAWQKSSSHSSEETSPDDPVGTIRVTPVPVDEDSVEVLRVEWLDAADTQLATGWVPNLADEDGVRQLDHEFAVTAGDQLAKLLQPPVATVESRQEGDGRSAGK